MPIYTLDPVIKNYIWGGTLLRDRYGKKGEAPLAESWDLSFHPDGLTLTDKGRSLKEVLSSKDLGSNCISFGDFPLLVKFIDASQALSVQVHPSDAYARAEENSYGKTEMWYVVEAASDAGIYLGFSRDVTEDEVKNAISDGSFTDLLTFVPVKAGESYFIPAGTVHAIGSGCLICEIQQNSNLTYRIFDYGRRDAQGNLRELHVEKALRVMDRVPHRASLDFLPLDGEKTLGISRYFHASLLSVSGERTVNVDDASFLALSCISGAGTVDGIRAECGDSFFLTAGMGEVTLCGDAEFIAVSVRRYQVTLSSSVAILSDDLGRVLAKESFSGSADAFLDDFLAKYALTKEDVTVC